MFDIIGSWGFAVGLAIGYMIAVGIVVVVSLLDFRPRKDDDDEIYPDR